MQFKEKHSKLMGFTYRTLAGVPHTSMALSAGIKEWTNQSVSHILCWGCWDLFGEVSLYLGTSKQMYHTSNPWIPFNRSYTTKRRYLWDGQLRQRSCHEKDCEADCHGIQNKVGRHCGCVWRDLDSRCRWQRTPFGQLFSLLADVHTCHDIHVFSLLQIVLSDMFANAVQVNQHTMPMIMGYDE